MIWVAAAVIASQLVVGYLMLWILGKDTFAQTVPTAVYSALSYILALAWLVFATPAIIYKVGELQDLRRNGQLSKKHTLELTSRTQLGLKGLPTWTDIGLAPIGFIVATLFAGALTFLFGLFPWFNADQVQEIGFSKYLAGPDMVVAFIILVVVAPIAEELIFRGWLYSKLRNLFNTKLADAWSMVLSIFLVSLLFGIVHLQWNVGVNVFALSVVLCGLREITGTIYAGILTHIIKNGVAFFIVFISPNMM